MARGVPPPLVRRPISITILTISFLLVPIVLVVGLFIGVIVDLFRAARGDRRFRSSRSVVLICALLTVDFIFFLGVLTIFLASLFVARPTSDARFHRIMTNWATMLMRVIGVVIPMEIDLSELADFSFANSIVVARHRSLLDAVLPASIIGGAGLKARYTLKEDLRWEPNIDLVGHAIPHRFITRDPENLERELERIRDLGETLDDRSAAVIFPEGTFFTERRKQQIVSSLERRNPGRADAARSINHLLPPRPGGTLALLDGAPNADVVVFGHIGFEPFGTIPEILRNIGGSHPVRVKAWRFPRSEVPDDRDDRIDWLFERWIELDRWVDSEHRSQHP